jgi:hypothetical protein
MKCRRRFEMQTLTLFHAEVVSTRTAVGQFKGQFKGAMDEMRHIMFKMQALTFCDANNEHARRGRSVQGSVQGGMNVQGKFKM